MQFDNKPLREHPLTALNNFIGGWYLPDLSVCDKLIEAFIETPDKHPGVSGRGIDKTVKASTDWVLPDSQLLAEYGVGLQQCLNAYINKYPWSNLYAPWRLDACQIQHYAPQEGYFGWHCERSGIHDVVIRRHLVFITYLNDVTDAGETEFAHQELKVKPEKGLTIVWPVDWTFTHRGVASPTQDKYIATGWLDYIKTN